MHTLLQLVNLRLSFRYILLSIVTSLIVVFIVFKFYQSDLARRIKRERQEYLKEDIIESLKELTYSNIPLDVGHIKAMLITKQIEAGESLPVSMNEIITLTQGSFMKDKFLPLAEREALVNELEAIKEQASTNESTKGEVKNDFLNSFYIPLIFLVSIISLIGIFTYAYQQRITNIPVVVILTAIKEEYSAIMKHLKNVSNKSINDTIYELGFFELNERVIAKIIVRECGPKNITASQETERAIQSFNPQVIFFVGIAGSRKPHDFTIGDVIFPDKVYYYEGGKSTEESFMSRPELVNMNYTLLELAKNESRKEDWKILLKDDWKKKGIKAGIGPIASGEQVVEHQFSEIGKIISEHYNDTSAIEMEGFGFAKAAIRQGRETSNVMIGIVRGISDIIEPAFVNITNNSNDKRPAHEKQFASATAAAFTFWLIYKLQTT